MEQDSAQLQLPELSELSLVPSRKQPMENPSGNMHAFLAVRMIDSSTCASRVKG